MNNTLNKQQMFLDNNKLIYLTLKRYFPHIFANLDSREEYYQIGAIGLLKAIEKYDDNKAAFSTYAVSMIWGEIKRNIRDASGHIHYSRKITDIAHNLIAAYNENKIEDDYEFWIDTELSKLDISNHEKIGVRNYILKPINLETQSNEDENLTFANMISDDKSVIDDVLYNDYIKNISNKLNSQEQIILEKFLNGYNQIAIGNSIGISQAQVSRIQCKIKLLTIKELYKSGQYDLVINNLYKMCTVNGHINMTKLHEICRKYQIDLSKCPINTTEKRTLDMQKNEIIIYSKKKCQKLILKCAMKLILKNKLPDNKDDFKQSVKKLLISNNHDNNAILQHLDRMTNSQIKNCICLAKQTIEKYNYKEEYEITIDDSDFKTSKFIKREVMHEIKNAASNIKNVSIIHKTCDNYINSIISILECFKKDNLMLRF